jgi:hypothetical protein
MVLARPLASAYVGRAGISVVAPARVHAADVGVADVRGTCVEVVAIVRWEEASASRVAGVDRAPVEVVAVADAWAHALEQEERPVPAAELGEAQVLGAGVAVVAVEGRARDTSHGSITGLEAVAGVAVLAEDVP